MSQVNSLDAGAGGNATETIKCLACASCDKPLVLVRDIIDEPAEILKSDVYCYNLDILDGIHTCYSATNPSATRFDVIRFAISPSSHEASHVALGDEYTADHSWFPGFEWSFAHCPHCSHHLGWGFRGEGSKAGTFFLGLIVTRMRARDVKRETYDAAAAIPRSRRQVAADGEEAQESTSATQIVEAFLETFLRAHGSDLSDAGLGVEDIGVDLAEDAPPREDDST